MSYNDDNLDRLDELSKKLYVNDETKVPKKRPGVLHRIEPVVTKGWETTNAIVKDANIQIRKKENTPKFKKFFIGAVIFFVLAIGFGATRFFSGGSTISSNNISIDVFGNTFAEGGEELPLEIAISNTNSVPLEFADLIVEYSRGGSTNQADPSEVERKRIQIGDIKSGGSVIERTSLVLYGEQGSTKDISFILEYHVPNSNSIFKKIVSHKVTINSAPVSLFVDAPQSMTPNSDMSFSVRLVSNTTEPVGNIIVKMDYPPGFKFNGSTPETSSLSNVWRFDSLEPGEEVRIDISGTLLGEDGEDRVFRTYIGAPSASDKNKLGVTYNSLLTKIAITKPFLDARLAINSNPATEVIASPRSMIRGEITWANNLPTRIINAEITAKITGAVLNEGSIEASEGFYDSVNDTIVWNRDTNQVFASLEPGESGVVGFNFASLSLVRADQTLFENPMITVEISIKGRRPSEGDSVDEVKGFQKSVVKFTTDFAVVADTLRSVGPFANTGPIPPQVEQKTTYTLRWTLTNSASAVTGAEVRATLPPYVHFLGTVSPSSEDVSIDEATGELVWKAGNIQKGAGLSGNPKRVYVLLELIPSLSQKNTVPTLLNVTSAKGVDSYTGTNLTSSWAAITTKYVNDPAYVPGSEEVQ